ncbi:MAG: hypothetical protein R3B47_01380 [Bacteroidia bacterium]
MSKAGAGFMELSGFFLPVLYNHTNDVHLMLRTILIMVLGLSVFPISASHFFLLPTLRKEALRTGIDYAETRRSCEAMRLKLAAAANRDSAIDEAKAFLYQQLTHHIWPAWYGTEWDFNGISDKPGEGQIACGYFVSTTLKHAGFRLNRYRLAQQAASDICKALSPRVYRFSSLEALEQFLKTQSGEQLYVLGLDYHVGFIQQYDSTCSFTHSSYYEPARVTDERLDSSAALAYSNVYVLASLFEKKDLVEKWLSGSQVYP